jgi:hypothetical protein
MSNFGPNHHAAILWHSYFGEGTVSTHDSFNVSALADLGTGHYRSSFSTSASNAQYAPISSCDYNGVQGDIAAVISRASSSCNTKCIHDSGGARDMDVVYLAIFGDI